MTKSIVIVKVLAVLLLAVIALFASKLAAAEPEESMEDIVNQMLIFDEAKMNEMRGIADTINSNKEAAAAGIQQGILDDFDVYNPKKSEEEDSIYTMDGNLLVFISSSMPDTVLRNYMKQSPEGTLFVIRGPIGEDLSKIMPTVNYISRLLCGTDKMTEDTVCIERQVDINPVLFDLFSIDVVPAFIQTTRPLTEIVNDGSTGDYKMMKGAVSLKYVLEKFEGALQ